MDSGLIVDQSAEQIMKVGNLTSMFLTSQEMPIYPNTTTSLPGRGDHSAFLTMGTVIAAIFATIVLTASILTACIRPCRKPAEPDREESPDKKSHDEEYGLSKQIVEIEQFRLLGTSQEESTFTTSCDKMQESSHSGSSRSTLERSSDLSWDSSYDFTVSMEPNHSTLPWVHQCDADRAEDPGCRAWLLESVDRLEVIEEEPEGNLSHDSMYSSSPHSGDTASSDVHTNTSSSDSSLVYQSCRDGEDSDSMLDTAFSEHTNTDYRTCNENPCFGSSPSLLRTFPNYESPHAQHPSRDSGNPESEPSSDSDRYFPWLAADHSPSSGSDSAKDNSHNSGTSGEVSSGCFDLSYVTFHTLPESSSEDSGLQALYACFDPSLRRSKPARQSSPKSLASSPPKCCEYSPVKAN